MGLNNKGVICPYSYSRLVNMTNPHLNRTKHGFVFILLLLIGLIRTAAAAPTQLRYNGQTNFTSRELWKRVDGGGGGSDDNITNSEIIKNLTNSNSKLYKGGNGESISRGTPITNNGFINDYKNRDNISYIRTTETTSIDDINNTGGHIVGNNQDDIDILTTKSTTVLGNTTGGGGGGEKKKKKRKKIDRGNKEKLGKIIATTQTMANIINTSSTKQIKGNRVTTVPATTIITEPEITTFETKISTVSNVPAISLIDLTFENTERLEVLSTLSPSTIPPPFITTMASIVSNERDDIILNEPIINRENSDLSMVTVAPMIDVDNHETPPTLSNFDTTYLPTDAYFISGLSDLLLENGGYEKIAELEDTYETNANINIGQNMEEILNYKENSFNTEQIDLHNDNNNNNYATDIVPPKIELELTTSTITERLLLPSESTTENPFKESNNYETKLNKNDDTILQTKEKGRVDSVNGENVSGHRKKLRRKLGTRRRLNVNKSTSSPILSSFTDDTVLSKNISEDNIMTSTLLNAGELSTTEASITIVELVNVATTYQPITITPIVDYKANVHTTTTIIPLLSTSQEVNNYNDLNPISFGKKIMEPIKILFDEDEIVTATSNTLSSTLNNGTSFISDNFYPNHIDTTENIEIVHGKNNNTNISTVIEVEITENYNSPYDKGIDSKKLIIESEKYDITAKLDDQSKEHENDDAENLKNGSAKHLLTTDADLKQLVTTDGRERDDSLHVAIKTMKTKLDGNIEPNGVDNVMKKSINEEYEEFEVDVITTLPTVSLHDKSVFQNHSSSENERVSTINEAFAETTTKLAIEDTTINNAARTTTTTAFPFTSVISSRMPSTHSTIEMANENYDLDSYELNSDRSQNKVFDHQPVTSTEFNMKTEENVRKHSNTFGTSEILTTVEKPVTDDHHFDKGRPTTIDRDSDTIFYISNTEVKVVESIPTPNPNQENRFFPALYEEDVFIDFPGKNHSGRSLVPDKYEEDIILSPLKSNFDPMRGIDLINDDDNLSVSYVGESFIEIEESTSSPPTTATPSTTFPDLNNDHNTFMSSDVIIQPVIIPDIPMSIGVPVIAELPPQLELKRLTNMGSDFGQNNNNNNADMGYDDDNIMIDQAVVTFQELEPPGAYLKKAQLSAELKDMTAVPLAPTLPTPMKKKNGTKTLPVKRNGNFTSSTDIYSSNATAYYVEEEEVDTGFSDLQTLFLACLATLAPLFLSVLIAFAVRYLWRKYRRDHSGANGLIGDTSTDPLAVKSRTLSADELKSTESGLTIINRSSDTLESTSDMLTATKHDDGYYGGGGGGVGNKINHPGANGSVITMTLKNNHLIVETEERNDISRDARETKLHYSPSDKDGVFVVEVARGADSTGMAPSIRQNDKKVDQKAAALCKGDNGPYENGPTRNIVKEDDCKIANNQVQVHQPPDGVHDDDTTVGINGDDGFSVSSFRSSANTVRPQCYSANTGLSQSDLSINSSSGSNQNYCYGTQSAYNIEIKGYKSSSPVMCQQIPDTESTDDMKLLLDNNSSSNITNNSNSQDYDPNKPIITAAIYKQDTNGRDTDGNYQSSLNSDMIAHEGALQKKEAAFLEEQRLLGNGEEPMFLETTVMAKIELQNQIKEEEEKNKKLETENNIVADDQKNCLTTGKGDIAETLNSMIVENGDGYDSLLPEPPSSDEIHQLNELTLLDGANTMDSLPPPPPPTECTVDVQTTNGTTTVTTPSAKTES